jgi:acetyl esterase/lipase
MSTETPRHDITKKRVVYRIPGMEAVRIRRDVEYRVSTDGVLTMDLYYPPDPKNEARIPAVVFVVGYPDPGAQRILGCKFKEMESYISWGQLTAVSGLVGITYTTSNEPARDVDGLLQYVRQNAAALGVDENRIGIWAASGNAPTALSILMRDSQYDVSCAALCYGLMLDLDGATGVADGARQWRFANPSAGKTVADLRPDIPMLIVRAGRDEMPRLNETMDRFLSKALECNLPINFVNHPTDPHAFDIEDDSEMTREIVRQILSFMQFHLLPGRANG